MADRQLRDERVDDHSQASEANSRGRVVGCLAVILSRDTLDERLGHGLTMACDRRDLPPREPQLQRRGREDRRDEQEG